MADELDDLFGAIDGNEEAEETKGNPQNVEAEFADASTTDEAMNDATEKDDEKKEKEANDANMKDSSNSKKIYTNVMSAPTASRLRENGQKPSNTEGGGDAEKTKTQNDNTSSVKDIATGTSHDKSVRSYSAYPKNLPEGHQQPQAKPSSKPAKEYPFQLDPFQAQAVGYIEKEESVLVAAHTSAGKTAVAEYAIAKSLNNGQRVVYTSPIKVRTYMMCCCCSPCAAPSRRS